MEKNYYLALGLSSSATSDDIRTAYRRLAKIYHPDHGGSAARMQKINEAYRILSNPITKEKYDAAYFGKTTQAKHETHQEEETHNDFNDSIMVTLHILDADNGYIKQRRPLSFINPRYRHMIYDGNVYSYVSDYENHEITIVMPETFYQMYRVFDSECVRCKVMTKWHRIREMRIDEEQFQNNFRRYIIPGVDYIYAKEVQNCLLAMRKYEFESEKSAHEKRIKNTFRAIAITAGAICGIWCLLLNYNSVGNPVSDYSTDTSSSLSTGTNSSSSTTSPTEPDITPPQQPPYYNNWVSSYKYSEYTNLTIKTTSGGSKYYYVKICKPYTTLATQSVFIHAGKTVNVYVPSGTYEIKWTSGDVWYGEKHNFLNNSAQKADDTFTFNGENGWELTLYPVSTGNLTTETIGMDEF